MLRISPLENLPPVHEYWKDSVFDNLSEDDLEILQLILRRKLDVIADRYERKLFWKDRDRYMQLKTQTYKASPKRDCPF